MKFLVLVLSVGFLATPSVGQDMTMDVFYKKADVFLSKNVSMSKVNYKGLHAKPEELTELYSAIETMDLSTATENQKLAFYINAYNLLVIHQVVSKYPIKSPMEVPGFFDKMKHQVAGKAMTLNDLEKGTLFVEFKDPRLHMALVCAAKSCPPLREGAYFDTRVERQLDEAMISAVNDNDFIRVNSSKKKVELSMIFEWYKDDFKSKKNKMAYINYFRKSKIPSNYKVGYYEYDWSLNE